MKDYAHRTKSKQPARHLLPRVFILVSLLAVTILVYVFAHLRGQSKISHTLSVTPTPAKTEKPEIKQETKYHFYTLLPNRNTKP